MAALSFGHAHLNQTLLFLGLSYLAAFVLILGHQAYQMIYLLTAHLYTVSVSLERTAWLTRKRRFSIGDIGRVRRRSITFMGMEQPALLVENRSGTPAFWLMARQWDTAGLDEFFRSIDISPIGSWGDREDFYKNSDVPRW